MSSLDKYFHYSIITLPPPIPRLSPYTTLFRSAIPPILASIGTPAAAHALLDNLLERDTTVRFQIIDRKSTRLNSSHQIISYAVFCLKKKIINNNKKYTDI